MIIIRISQAETIIIVSFSSLGNDDPGIEYWNNLKHILPTEIPFDFYFIVRL